MKQEDVFKSTILRGVVGSTAHGTGLEGQEDRDEMGIFIEPPEYVCGLKKVEGMTIRSQPEGTRSGPGDLDLMFYSLRKFCHLAVNGNPSVMLLLWLPEYMVLTKTGIRLINLRQKLHSKEAGKKYLGYLTSQKLALTGEKGKKVKRPELVEKFGYDTKFAMHALRLGYQGIEFISDRQIRIPVPYPYNSTLLAVRHGDVSYPEVIKLIEDAEGRLKSLVDNCEAVADFDAVNNFLIEEHRRYWDENSRG